MHAKLLFISLFISTIAVAQTITTDNLLIGYQEFPTTISSHAADASGNQYYTGTFKGQLTVNNQVLTNGNGLEDIFWVKTNPNGQVIKHKIFGSTGSDISRSGTLTMGNSTHMLFGMNIYEPITIGAFNITPYSTSFDKSTGVIAYCDTAGVVSWVRKTNLDYFRLFYSNGLFHLIGGIWTTSPAVKIDNQVVLDSVGRAGFVHLMFSENGTFLSANSITAKLQYDVVEFKNIGFFSDNKLMFHFQIVGGNGGFYVNNFYTPMPADTRVYQYLVKTDTSYNNPKVKALNPMGQNLNQLSGGPAICMANDSVYMADNFYYPYGPLYILDGFQQVAQKNYLYVLDSSLTAKRQVFLGNSFAGNSSDPFKKSVQIVNLLVRNGTVYLGGMFAGSNESPLNLIPANDTVVSILPNVLATVNRNGPSRSFIAKCQLDGQGGSINWYGEHTEYERSFISPSHLHDAGLNRIAFHQQADNVWNPWLIDQDLTLLKGSMRKNADDPEVPRIIRYLNDGSRIVFGNAHGKTALDSSGTFISNEERTDVFIVRIKPNNEVVWFKRLHSTLPYSSLQGIEMRNNKAWFLINYSGMQNDSNYIKVGTFAYPVKSSASLLASIDTSGNITVLNLSNPLLRDISLRHFSFFTNGDLLAATQMTTTFAYQNFPNYGNFLLRIDPSTGALINARKLEGASIMVNNIQVDNNDKIYLALTSFSNYSFPSLRLHDGSNYISNLSISTNSGQLPSLVKMDWNQLYWYRLITGAYDYQQFGILALSNNKPVMEISPIKNQPLYFQGQLVNNGFPGEVATLLKIDTNGTLISHKTFQNMSRYYFRTGSNGQVYFSGVSKGISQADTIQIGYSGGFVDGVALVIDSNFITKRSFRVGSPYGEAILDMDIYQDSLVALAYISQTTPQFYLNKMLVADGDYEQDGYLGTVNLKPNVVTAIDQPLPVLHLVSITPNPIINHSVDLKITVPESLRSTALVYNLSGQLITSTTIQLLPGTGQYKIALPASAGRGIYQVVIDNKKWKTVKRFVVM